jgi:fructose-1,6-bisphosphatase/inositol monophosphatase family enzyme
VNVTISSIAALVDAVKAAGVHALERRRELDFGARGIKADGSVITAVDHEVEALLAQAIGELYPEAGILGEESTRTWTADRRWTFAVDPIDGTDSFSQGMPGWGVSVGLLDASLQPVAGIVAAPALDLLLVADLDGSLSCNGVALQQPPDPGPLSLRSNLMVSSRSHRDVELSRFPGKIRSLGSAALHLCSWLVFPGVIGAVQGAGCSIWDIAGAHAISRAAGGDVVRLDGGAVDYAALTGGAPCRDILVGGPTRRLDELRSVLSR